MMNLNLVVDMKGCPNRCKHCWLGHMPNKHLNDEDAVFIVNEFKKHFENITFYSWLREPDFCSNYRDRWEKDIEISTGNKPERFELASFYKIVREPDYVKFLKDVGTKKVQLTFFGLKELTDKYTERVGAFEELLKATEILIENDIAPRWQAFINEENKDDIVRLFDLIEELNLRKRCDEFEFFVHEGSCDGENRKLYDIRINKHNIPKELIPYYLNYKSILSEAGCCEVLKESNENFVPHNDGDITLIIANNFDIYFNFTNVSPNWRIGNLKEDKIDEIVRRIVYEDIEALRIARSITLKDLVELYGDSKSDKVFDLDDYKMFLLNKHIER